MIQVFIIFFIVLALYAAFVGWLGIGFFKTTFFHAKEKYLQVPLSIIICARNEEKNIGRCLSGILNQEYVLNKIQLILINDASNDATVSRAEAILNNSGINYKIISNSQQKGKKESISYAMQFANSELIVMRDADTFTRSNKWLQTISDFYQNNHSDLIIAPVAIANNVGILWAMQAIENNILALFACGSNYFKKAFLCNGANLIFTKSIFEKTNGYQSHIQTASGDDVLFMEDVKKISGAKIDYLKSTEAIVYTYPCYSLKTLFNQKIRWASKFKVNDNKLNFALALISFGVNLAWLFCFAYVYAVPAHKLPALIFILFKLKIDILLLFLASSFIKNKSLLWFSLPVGCIYSLYACLVGLASVFIKPTWKK